MEREMCSDSEAVSYLRLIDFVDHLSLGLGVINKKKRSEESCLVRTDLPRAHGL